MDECDCKNTIYADTIFSPINKAIKPHDTDNILDHYFLNSRGAIARFDRNAIEIRLVDIQESPKADIAICVLIIEVIKLLVSEKTASLETQKSFTKEVLFDILNASIKHGEDQIIDDMAYLNVFEINQESSAKNVWKHLYNMVKPNIDKSHYEALEIILDKGSLSTRILNALKTDFSEENIKKVYLKLADCLQQNTMFNS